MPGCERLLVRGEQEVIRWQCMHVRGCVPGYVRARARVHVRACVATCVRFRMRVRARA